MRIIPRIACLLACSALSSCPRPRGAPRLEGPALMLTAFALALLAVSGAAQKENQTLTGDFACEGAGAYTLCQNLWGRCAFCQTPSTLNSLSHALVDEQQPAPAARAPLSSRPWVSKCPGPQNTIGKAKQTQSRAVRGLFRIQSVSSPFSRRKR
jgi:hypothetical protein